MTAVFALSLQNLTETQFAFRRTEFRGRGTSSSASS